MQESHEIYKLTVDTFVRVRPSKGQVRINVEVLIRAARAGPDLKFRSIRIDTVSDIETLVAENFDGSRGAGALSNDAACGDGPCNRCWISG